MYLLRSEGHLSGCDTARLLLDRLAGCGPMAGRARSQWEGSHRPRRKGTFVLPPVELESCGRGWLGVGFHAPYRRHTTYMLHAACQAGTYVDWRRAAVTRVPLDRFVYARRKKGGGRLALAGYLGTEQRPATVGLELGRAEGLPRGVSGPATVHPRRLLSASTANNTADWW